MNALVQPRAYTKAMVTTKRKTDQLAKGTRLRVIIEPFVLRKQGGAEIQVYSDIWGKEYHAAMNWADFEDHFDDVEHLPNAENAAQ